MTTSFIRPAAPKRAARPPTGPGWIHEVKHDGFRVQVHVARGSVTVYSRNGSDFTRRCASLLPALTALPVRSAVIDAELVACGSDGMPSFKRLMFRDKRAALCLWAFDLLAMDRRLLLQKPLEARRERLARILDRAPEQVRYSEAFDDPVALLAACERLGLEGIVSKRCGSPYRSGDASGWVKVKTQAWREANRDRWELFETSQNARARITTAAAKTVSR